MKNLSSLQSRIIKANGSLYLNKTGSLGFNISAQDFGLILMTCLQINLNCMKGKTFCFQEETKSLKLQQMTFTMYWQKSPKNSKNPHFPVSTEKRVFGIYMQSLSKHPLQKNLRSMSSNLSKPNQKLISRVSKRLS